jgi:DNA repair exonuclease SbcCD ATPase subunit
MTESIEDLRSRLDDLEDRVDNLEDEKSELEDTVEAQAETIASQREQLGEQRERLSEYEEKLDVSSDHRKHLQQRVHALEDSEDTDSDETTMTRSPLQQLISLPSKAVSKLTANQERARFIAKDIGEYAKKVPAGYAIDSGTIRKVLKAKESQTPHTQTVSRVMDFIDRLGKEDVQVVKRRGTKRAVFTEHAVTELGNTSTGGITDVVMRWR